MEDQNVMTLFIIPNYELVSKEVNDQYFMFLESFEQGFNPPL